MKPLKLWSNHTVLRTVADFRGSHGSLFLLYLARKQISVHKEFEHKKKKQKKKTKNKKQKTNCGKEEENRELSW